MPAATTITTTRVSLQDAASSRKIGYSTLRKRIADGDLPAERVGRRIFVRVDDLEAMSEPIVGRPQADRAVDAAITRIVSAAPRLTTDQRERLAIILGGAA